MAAKPRIVVIGSSYVDLAVRCKDVPLAGETVPGSALTCRSTGPGPIQATQAAFCGCEVYLITKTGNDPFGQIIRSTLEQYEINTELVTPSSAKGTGAIFTMVNSLGENATCVSAGANYQLKFQDIEAAQAEAVISTANACLIHGDLPQETVVAAIRLAQLHKVKVLLDPAYGNNGNTRKSIDLPMDYFTVDVLLPNLQEVSELADEPVNDIHKAKLIGSDLVARGCANVVIKMGRRGCMIINREGTEHIPPFEIEMVDKTCAGDAFAGALAACYAVSNNIIEAARFAAAAGALACTKFGCQEALPRKQEILELLHSA